ncbi:GGDEF domain-containing protein [Noviherbaspirillum galbum]|uniref:diguanylate cyclase n=1 Tax=Noviherbaspirillum galbum TaxID=2709383 RepID=A0A6B3SWU7_9BURK|nr:GGDEF domain-containing protein [Noviherbaspirillum galbum]NEX63955.1 GGDEF domain-containing protein [Noviherbaspirillum galbum]
MGLRQSLVYQRRFPLIRLLLPQALLERPSDMTRAENMVTAMLLALAVLPFYGAVYAFLTDHATARICYFGAFCVAICAALLRATANLSVVRECFVGGIFVLLVGIIYRTGGIVSPAVLWLGVCSIIGSAAGGAKAGWRWTATSLVVVPLIYAADLAGVFPQPVVRDMRALNFISIMSFTLLVAVFLVIYERINSSAIRKLDHALGLIRTLAIHDELTGIVNRREVLRFAAQEMMRSTRSATPFCLCLIDVDHFKRINDMHGHPVGDEVLRRIAGKIKEDIRATDCFGRYGGEEFLLILTDTDLTGGAEFVERIRQSVSTLHLTELGGNTVTISVGIAQHRQQENLDQILSRADKALYAAKAGGRNQIVLADLAAFKDARKADTVAQIA